MPINDNVLDCAEGGSEDHQVVGKAANVNLNKRVALLDVYLSHLNKSVRYQIYKFIACLFSRYICPFMHHMRQHIG